VLAGQNGVAYYSNDGFAWTVLQPNGSATSGIKFFSGSSVYDVTYALGEFWVVGSGGQLAHSPDAINWTRLPSGTTTTGAKFGSETIYSIAHNGQPAGPNSRFVIVGDQGKASYSTDGINWTSLTPGTTTGIKFGAGFGSGAPAYRVCYGANTFVVVGAGKESYSLDGISWTAMLPSTGSGVLDQIKLSDTSSSSIGQGVAFGNGKFFTVGSGMYQANVSGPSGCTSPFYTRASYSLDGANWTSIIARSGYIDRVSPPGCIANPNGPETVGMKMANQIQCVAYGAGTWVVAGIDGEAAYSTDGGSSWTRLVPGVSTGIKFGTSNWAHKIAFGLDKFIVVGDRGRVAYSFNGINWFQEHH
jgi:hypothetical protein